MSIWDMFSARRGNATGSGAGDNAGGNQPPNNQPIATDPSGANPTVPGDKTVKSDGSVGAIPKAGEGDKSPLEGYKDLWQPNVDKDGKAIPVTKSSIAPTFTIDPKKMLENAKGMDFTKAISPETAEKLAKGDATAFAAAINEVGQAAYAQATVASTKILETALQKQAETFEKTVMPEILRKHSISTALRADNPLFDNPAVAPMLSMVERQMAEKYPAASPQEITMKAREYMSGFASELLTASGKVITDKPSGKSSEGLGNVREPTDWGKFFGVDNAA